MRKYRQGYTPGNMILDVDGKHPCWTERLIFTFQKEAYQTGRESMAKSDTQQNVASFLDLNESSLKVNNAPS